MLLYLYESLYSNSDRDRADRPGEPREQDFTDFRVSY